MQGSLTLMHRKQDEVGQQMCCFGRELSDTRKRIEVLEQVGAEHSTSRKAAIVRMDVLETSNCVGKIVLSRERIRPGEGGP